MRLFIDNPYDVGLKMYFHGNGITCGLGSDDV